MDCLMHQQCPRCEGALPHGSYLEIETGIGNLLVLAHCEYCGIVVEAAVSRSARSVVALRIIDRARNWQLYRRALRDLQRAADEVQRGARHARRQIA